MKSVRSIIVRRVVHQTPILSSPGITGNTSEPFTGSKPFAMPQTRMA